MNTVQISAGEWLKFQFGGSDFLFRYEQLRIDIKQKLLFIYSNRLNMFI